jgi:hypothetical protein
MNHMKFFLPELPEEDSDFDCNAAAWEAYGEHIRRISGQIPGDLLKVATSYSLHDGLFQGIRLYRRQVQLVIMLVCGDNQRGYSNAELKYTGLDCARCTIDELRRIARRRRAEINDNEIDLIRPGVYEHRFLCWPKKDEFVVRFSGFALKVTPLPSREFVPWKPRFAIID